MPRWPTGSVSKAHSDHASDDPAQWRTDLNTLVDKVNAMIAAFAQANGVCDLDAHGSVPAARLALALRVANDLSDLGDATTALTNLGSTDIGRDLFTAGSAAAARNVIAVDQSGTTDATPSTLMKRDASGRAKVADPAADEDIATKGYVDNEIGGLDLNSFGWLKVIGTGSGSKRSFEGNTTVSANNNFSGVHLYRDFTLNAGATITVPADGRCLVIIANAAITINGTINASGAGVIGADGTDQPGGGAGRSVNSIIISSSHLGGTITRDVVLPGYRGGHSLANGAVVASGGSGGNPNGGNAAQRTTDTALLGFHPLFMVGGGGGSTGIQATVQSVYHGQTNSGTPGSGGRGGGSIVLVASTVTLGSNATLNTSGANGGNGTYRSGAGGGGGAGNIYIVAETYTDHGATFTQNGGTGGVNTSTGGDGGNGTAGFRQIFLVG